MFNVGDIVKFKCGKTDYTWTKATGKIMMNNQLAVVCKPHPGLDFDITKDYYRIEFLIRDLGSMRAHESKLELILTLI